jgi:serine/threonine protein kinase
MRILTGYEPIEIWEGGMSNVVICKSQIDRTFVAIKVIKPELSFNRNLAKRWLNECYSWMRLGDHQNIVQPKRVHIVDGQPQIVLEYIESSLRDVLLEKQRLDPRLTIKYGLEICKALQWASRQIS